MPNLVQTYALHDADPSGHGGAIRINRASAAEWNAKGFGIFHTVQEFRGKRRLENLVHINAWAVDMDKGTKPEMLERIKRGLTPTMVVETKNGFHVYWKAKDATRETWPHIVQNRLVPYYEADKKAKDLARILRTPGYYHQKDPSDPFLVKRFHYQHVEYSAAELLHFYRDTETAKKQKRLHAKTRKEHPLEGSFWDRVWGLDCEYALSRLSGTAHVGFETYDFKQNASGTKNIYVNGKSTSSWIDTEGRIGSMDDGGPTIAQWLNWFHKDYRRVVEIIKEVFPECSQEEQIKLI
jgi:predicted metallopeptidase